MDKKKLILSMILSFILIVVIFLSLTFDLDNPLYHLKQTIFNYNKDSTYQVIVLSRITRIIIALLVGSSLAISGFLMQVQYKNDLADPSLMGVSDGSALLITASIIIIPNLGMMERMIVSIFGSFLAYFLIFYISRVTYLNNSKLSLPVIGIVISMLLGSITTFISSYFNIGQAVSSWYTSRLYRVSFSDVVIFFPVIILIIFSIFIFRKHLDASIYDDEIKISIGMNLSLWNNIYGLIVVVLTGLSVALVGRISFVGLIVPHIIRLLFRKKNSIIFFGVAACGALLVLISDYISRIINYPFETPIGVVISLIGVPIFLYLIRRGAEIH